MESFNKLKHLLTTALILKIVDPFKDFIVCIDACNEGLGGVLVQDNYVVAYESKKLKDHEKNYVTQDLELAAIIHALKIWWHYLIGRKSLLISDNISLKYLFDQQNLNARKDIWISFLREYDFEIKHIKGKENKVANALSQHANFLCANSSYESDPGYHILNTGNSNGEYQRLKKRLLKMIKKK